jgi:hypothetical protein
MPAGPRRRAAGEVRQIFMGAMTLCPSQAAAVNLNVAVQHGRCSGCPGCSAIGSAFAASRSPGPRARCPGSGGSADPPVSQTFSLPDQLGRVLGPGPFFRPPGAVTARRDKNRRRPLIRSRGNPYVTIAAAMWLWASVLPGDHGDPSGRLVPGSRGLFPRSGGLPDPPLSQTIGLPDRLGLVLGPGSFLGQMLHWYRGHVYARRSLPVKCRRRLIAVFVDVSSGTQVASGRRRGGPDAALHNIQVEDQGHM